MHECELFIVCLQFPLYWFSVPGILKGWIDRVLTQGFAFTLDKIYDNGIFKVCISVTNHENISSRNPTCPFYNRGLKVLCYILFENIRVSLGFLTLSSHLLMMIRFFVLFYFTLFIEIIEIVLLLVSAAINYNQII